MPDKNIFPKAWMEFTLSNDGKIRGSFDGIAGKVTSEEILGFYCAMRKIIWEEMKDVCRHRRHPKIAAFIYSLKCRAK